MSLQGKDGDILFLTPSQADRLSDEMKSSDKNGKKL